MLIKTLLSCLLLPLGIMAALDDKAQLANRTIDRTISLRTHSIYPPYIDQDLQNRWWDFGADAYVNTNKYIRLTRARASQMGWLWSRAPLTASNFVLEIEFKVSGDNNHLYGDGLAIWLTKDRAQPGPVFGSKDNFEGLGLFLDTYANSRHPYSFPRINAMLGDGKTSYDLDNDGEKNSLGACSANFRRTNVATKLKITYLREQYLNVKIQYKAWDEWTDCFTVQGVTLPLAPYIGFSALTGDVSDNHDIISITTYSAILSSPDAQRDKLTGNAGRKFGISQSSSWTWTFVKLFLFVGVVAGALYGYKQHTLRQSRGGLGGGTFGSMGRTMQGLGGAFDSKRF
ncbi:legume-like lectin family-domain-containing protein [Epithele typhae]|uniref:legume-like lectin family-domain-containing protein n=1 Tax=Epithele typhae TaxID=378194 RepID=UPI002007DDC0|nr:legume-like lectin family-domain-containing protein [Epithele typhae]KAH9909430.1 legume-like lectin family-domain-containing protein [Epithele typhae]